MFLLSYRAGNAIKLVENTSAIARMGNRVLQIAKQESENSEDPRFISTLNYAANQVNASKYYFVKKWLCISNFCEIYDKIP